MNYIIPFIAFVIFLLCQYCIWVVSNFTASYLGATGKIYWALVVVLFLLLNEFCFGAYDFQLFSDEDELDEDDWLDED